MNNDKRPIFIPNTQNKYCGIRTKHGAFTVFTEDKETKTENPTLKRLKLLITPEKQTYQKEFLSFFEDIVGSVKSDCWWCTKPFKNIPVSLPIGKRKDEYIFHGIFCSWECCKTFSISQKDPQVEKRNTFISDVVKDIYGKKVTIKKTLPRYRLKHFGGDLDIKTFRANTNDQFQAKDVPLTPLTIYALQNFM